MSFLVPLPASQSSRALLPPTDPSTGVVTFTARPTRHAWVIGQDMLAALGINHDVYGSGRRHGEDLEYARAWLTAHDVRLVIIRHADTIPRSEILDDLEHLSSSVGADLVLTCDDTVGENLADWITARGGTITDLPALRSLIATMARTPQDVQPDAPVDFPQYLPRADFYAFRARLRDVLRPDQFTMADRLYRTTFRTIADHPPATPVDAAATLTALIAQHRTPGQALTIARAAQAALFTHGLLLKVNIDTLLHGTAAAEHRRMTPPEIRSLRAYRTAWRSVAAILYDADLSKQEIHAVRLDQVSPDGDLIGVDHLPLLDDAKVYLRAQRTYRLITGATANDALIDQTRQSVVVALRRLGSELNLPAPSNHVPVEAKKSDRWQSNLGVALLPLVGLRLTGVPSTEPQTEEAA